MNNDLTKFKLEVNKLKEKLSKNVNKPSTLDMKIVI